MQATSATEIPMSQYDATRCKTPKREKRGKKQYHTCEEGDDMSGKGKQEGVSSSRFITYLASRLLEYVHDIKIVRRGRHGDKVVRSGSIGPSGCIGDT